QQAPGGAVFQGFTQAESQAAGSQGRRSVRHASGVSIDARSFADGSGNRRAAAASVSGLRRRERAGGGVDRPAGSAGHRDPHGGASVQDQGLSLSALRSSSTRPP